jgi:hypothetical protein
LLGALIIFIIIFLSLIFFSRCILPPWPLRPSVHHYCLADIAALPTMPSDGDHWSTLHFWKLSCSPGNFWVLSLYLSFIGDNSLCVKILILGCIMDFDQITTHWLVCNIFSIVLV